MCPSSFVGGDAENAVRSRVGVGVDGVSHAREETVNVRSGVEHDGGSGALCARRNGVKARGSGGVNVHKSGAFCARRSSVNVQKSGIDHDGVEMIENSVLSFSFSCAETRNVEDG